MTGLEHAARLLAAAARLPVDAIPPSASAESLPQWDSVAHVHLMLSVEEALGRELEPPEISAMVSLSAIARLLDDAA